MTLGQVQQNSHLFSQCTFKQYSYDYSICTIHKPYSHSIYKCYKCTIYNLLYSHSMKLVFKKPTWRTIQTICKPIHKKFILHPIQSVYKPFSVMHFYKIVQPANISWAGSEENTQKYFVANLLFQSKILLLVWKKRWLIQILRYSNEFSLTYGYSVFLFWTGWPLLFLNLD